MLHSSSLLRKYYTDLRRSADASQDNVRLMGKIVVIALALWLRYIQQGFFCRN